MKRIKVDGKYVDMGEETHDNGFYDNGYYHCWFQRKSGNTWRTATIYVNARDEKRYGLRVNEFNGIWKWDGGNFRGAGRTKHGALAAAKKWMVGGKLPRMVKERGEQ